MTGSMTTIRSPTSPTTATGCSFNSCPLSSLHRPLEGQAHAVSRQRQWVRALESPWLTPAVQPCGGHTCEE
eukprot:m.55871 g.55871  ORF g.55871 m.55871 type:complete len:71 (+) comp9277_c0_seq1:1324-1536(+)